MRTEDCLIGLVAIINSFIIAFFILQFSVILAFVLRFPLLIIQSSSFLHHLIFQLHCYIALHQKCLTPINFRLAIHLLMVDDVIVRLVVDLIETNHYLRVNAYQYVLCTVILK